MADAVAGFACHRAPISGGSIQIRHKPGLPLRAISRRPGDDDLAGIPGHLKALEWNRQTLSPRFHVGLFSCPEAEKGPVALLSVKFREEFALSRGEYSSCNVEEIGQFRTCSTSMPISLPSERAHATRPPESLTLKRRSVLWGEFKQGLPYGVTENSSFSGARAA